jgi:tRNA isopentenyl-2-thiomethyl-A-37 hydroxylase MiaE
LPADHRAQELEIELSDWVFQAVEAQEVMLLVHLFLLLEAQTTLLLLEEEVQVDLQIQLCEQQVGQIPLLE